MKEDDGTKVFYPFPQDVEIIKAVRKLPYSIKSAFYEDPDWREQAKGCDVILNLCDAFESPDEECALIAEFEKLRLPFTGCSSHVAKMCQDKYGMKRTLKQHNIKFAEGATFKTNDDRLPEHLKFPLILKPIGEDGSNGIEEDSVVFDEEHMRKKLAELFAEFKHGVLAERYVDGREFNVPMIGNEDPAALSPLEIDFSENFEGKPKILTYKAKWSKNSNDYKNTYSGVAKITEAEKEKLTKTAVAAYKAAGCTGYGSVDMRMDSDGNVYVLEVNPNCYIAPEADIVKASKDLGITYEQLLDKIINYALERFEVQKQVLS